MGVVVGKAIVLLCLHGVYHCLCMCKAGVQLLSIVVASDWSASCNGQSLHCGKFVSGVIVACAGLLCCGGADGESSVPWVMLSLYSVMVV